ncbi:MAG: hypothetical protein ACOCWH_06015 [Spirochaetota bacterium]
MTHTIAGFVRAGILVSIVAALLVSCKTTPVDPVAEANEAFLSQSNGDTFRVVMMSDRYIVRQKKYEENLSRIADESGDQYFMERLNKMNVINAAREGEIRVWVYPDSGRLMKVRFMESTYIEEVDKLIIDDIQRWTLDYKRGVYPLKFNVRYLVVLQKKMSDTEIRQHMRESQEQ